MNTDAQHLGRLRPVDLRKVWNSEADDFTPWLAKEEKLFDESLTRNVILPDEGPWYDWWNPSAGPIAGQTLMDVSMPDSRQVQLVWNHCPTVV